MHRPLPLAFLLLASTTAHAADAKLSVSSGLDYSIGSYGETEDTTTWFLPLNLKYQRGPMTLKLGMAYVWMTGPQTVTPEGEPLPGGGVVTTVEGFGDVTASLVTNVLDEDTAPLDLDLTGKIKFATADADKALGTGANDYSLQVSLYKTVGAWGPYLDLGYRWKGDPAGLDYHNVWYATVGASMRLSRLWSGGADYSWRDKLTPTSSPMSEATVYANYRLSDRNRLVVYGVAGFSDASPDWGLGFTLGQLY